MATSTDIASWLLESTNATPPQYVTNVGRAGQEEALWDEDLRVLAAQQDFMPGGKYRAIVKLQIRFANQIADDQRWAQGTGWLIQPDMIVTAGQCAFDHSNQFGRAVQVKAYVGYSGKHSLNNPAVQFRSVRRIATPQPWIVSDSNSNQDVSFMQLDKPFSGVTPFKYQPTPTQGRLMLGVVGYPGDHSLDGESGAQMYEMYKPVSFDLAVSNQNMLEYPISAYPGQTGSPVLVQGTYAVVGTHVASLGSKSHASVIRGSYGSDYSAYLTSFVTSLQGMPTTNGVSILKASPPRGVPNMRTTPFVDEDESFWDTLKKVMSVGSSVGRTVFPSSRPNSIARNAVATSASFSFPNMLGPIGNPLSAVAGIAFDQLTRLEEQTEVDDGSQTPFYKGRTERAVLAEAALEAMMKMDSEQMERYDLIKHMEKSYQKQKPYVAAAVPILTPVILRSAATITEDMKNADREDTISATQFSFSNAGATPDGETDLRQWLGVQSDNERKKLWESLQRAFGTGSRTNSASSIANFNSSDAKPAIQSSHDAATTASVQTLIQRSIMGDAALQALMTIPPHEAVKNGFLDGIKDAVKKLGGTVIRVAPEVIKGITPAIQSTI